MRLTALDCSHVIGKNCSEECSCEISTTASNLILTTDEKLIAARRNNADSTTRSSTKENQNSDFIYIAIAATVSLVAILLLASFCIHKKIVQRC